jgi:hypothetical protein
MRLVQTTALRGELMFDFFKNRRTKPQSEVAETLVDQAIAEVAAKWIHFTSSIHFNEEIGLADIVRSFSSPAHEFIQKKYPTLAAQDATFWQLIFTSIAKSGTHSADVINAAIASIHQVQPTDPPSHDSKKPLPIGGVLDFAVEQALKQGEMSYLLSKHLQVGEKILEQDQVKAVLAASTYLGVLDAAGSQGLTDTKAMEEALGQAILAHKLLSVADKKRALWLVDQFYVYKVIREEHAFDDWITEAWWNHYQSIAYRYPSGMSDLVTVGMTIRSIGSWAI